MRFITEPENLFCRARRSLGNSNRLEYRPTGFRVEILHADDQWFRYTDTRIRGTGRLPSGSSFTPGWTALSVMPRRKCVLPIEYEQSIFSSWYGKSGDLEE